MNNDFSGGYSPGGYSPDPYRPGFSGGAGESFQRKLKHNVHECQSNDQSRIMAEVNFLSLILWHRYPYLNKD